MSKLTLVTSTRIARVACIVTCLGLTIASIDADVKAKKYNKLTTELNKITINFRWDRSNSELYEDLKKIKELREKRNRIYSKSKLNIFVTYNGQHENDDTKLRSLINLIEQRLNESADEVEAEVIED